MIVQLLITIINLTGNANVDKVLTIGTDILGLKNITIVANNYNKGDSDITAFVTGSFGNYNIYINPNINEDEFIKSLSHELIHIAQFQSDRLIMETKNGTTTTKWEGRFWDYANIDYFNRPWEREAFVDGKNLARKIKLKLCSY